MLRPLLCLSLCAASAWSATLAPIPKPETVSEPLRIVTPCVPARPFTAAGEHGAILGRQNGVFEAWVWPVKVLSNFRIRAELANYPVPIDVNALAAEIVVTPAETVITYSHAAFTIRQHMFASRNASSLVQVAAFFEIESVRPLDITFSFVPQMLKMWPAPNFGIPNSEWVQKGSDGAYLLHTDNPEFSAVVAMPRAKPGILIPYQEHPQTYPTEFKLTYDPGKDAGLVFPLVMAMANKANAVEQAAELIGALPAAYADAQQHYQRFFDKRTTIETPDNSLNDALKWAEIAIDQARVAHGDETGLIAGYYESADSARPGYAWFFGRDTLFTTFAVNSYGDFDLSRRALTFLLSRQRADGKIMHEFSQAAESIDWKATPYFYASADSTPLLIMAMWDYVRSSGDLAFLKSNWSAVLKAWEFVGKHADPDGLYSNSEGTGWVESWPPGMPKKEIYLAAVQEQAASALSRLAELMGESELSADSSRKSKAIAQTIEKEYFDSANHFYAFSRDGESMDTTASIYPSLAWWQGDHLLEQPDQMLRRWASSEFSTDWGTRDISPKTSFYDPISYHQGSVWPLFTGWVSLAEYRAGRPLSGYSHLMQNVNLTWEQDLGSVTELLSGEYYQPLGRSSSHQLWSSAMIITPLLRGLFGVQGNAAAHTISVKPSLPADWEHARVAHYRLGEDFIDLDFQKSGADLVIRATTPKPTVLCLTEELSTQQNCTAKRGAVHSLTLKLPAVEIGVKAEIPAQGAMTSGVKVLNQEITASSATFLLSAPAGTSASLTARLHRSGITVSGASLQGDVLLVNFPTGAGYQEKTVKFTW